MAQPSEKLVRMYPELRGCTPAQWGAFIEDCRQRHEIGAFVGGMAGVGGPCTLAVLFFLNASRTLTIVADGSGPQRLGICGIILVCLLPAIFARDLTRWHLVLSDLRAGHRPAAAPAREAPMTPEHRGLFLLSGYRAFPELDGLTSAECRRLADYAAIRFHHSHVVSLWMRWIGGSVALVAWYGLSGACCIGGRDSLMGIVGSPSVGIVVALAVLAGGPLIAWAVVRAIANAWLSSVMPKMLDRNCCPQCGYHLEGLDAMDPALICPECGSRGLREMLSRPLRRDLRW